MKHKQEAIDDGFMCPHCGGIYVQSYEEPLITTSHIYLDVACLDCEKEWVETYKLTDMKEKSDVKFI
jgi:hypothetical protein